MSRFRDRHPDIDVMVSANNKLIDFADGTFEMAIRYGQGNYPGLRTDRLLGDEVFPVCSPKLLQGARPLRTPEDLNNNGRIIWKRSEEHTSELQSLMRISYAVFCLKKKKSNTQQSNTTDDINNMNEEI